MPLSQGMPHRRVTPVALPAPGRRPDRRHPRRRSRPTILLARSQRNFAPSSPRRGAKRTLAMTRPRARWPTRSSIPRRRPSALAVRLIRSSCSWPAGPMTVRQRFAPPSAPAWCARRSSPSAPSTISSYRAAGTDPRRFRDSRPSLLAWRLAGPSASSPPALARHATAAQPSSPSARAAHVLPARRVTRAACAALASENIAAALGLGRRATSDLTEATYGASPVGATASSAARDSSARRPA